MSTRTLAAAVPLALLVAGCGGGGGGGGPVTGPAPGPRTSTFSGTASTNATGGCLPGAHTVVTGAGSITVAVTQASAPRIKLQICHPTAVNHATECTVPPFASIAIGESVTATLKGGSSQSVALFPESCGSPGNPPASSVTYSVTVTYPGG